MSSINYWRVTIEPEYATWETCRDESIIAIGYEDYPDNFNVRRFKDVMKKGDKVVVYLKNGRVGALGVITGDYSVDDVTLKGVNWYGEQGKLNGIIELFTDGKVKPFTTNSATMSKMHFLEEIPSDN